MITINNSCLAGLIMNNCFCVHITEHNYDTQHSTEQF